MINADTLPAAPRPLTGAVTSGYANVKYPDTADPVFLAKTNTDSWVGKEDNMGNTRIAVDKSLLRSLALLAAVVEARDPYTAGHLWRVSEYARLLSIELGLADHDVFRISLAGFLHDLGKIGVPDAVLNKPGELTPAEYAVVKTHPGIGASLVRGHPLGLLAEDAICHHHEWSNGKGYPDGLKKGQTSLDARIISIADAFDAMTSTRPYRTGMPASQALAEFARQQDRQFDGALLAPWRRLANAGMFNPIIRHSDEGLPLVECSRCGPVIGISRGLGDGDLVCCRICGTLLRLHRKGEGFETEPTGKKGDAEALKPAADTGPIDRLVRQAPATVGLPRPQAEG